MPKKAVKKVTVKPMMKTKEMMMKEKEMMMKKKQMTKMSSKSCM